MSPGRAGVLTAIVLTGWPLYQLVEAGQLDVSGALLRGILVAIAATVGIRWVQGLMEGFEAQKDTKSQAIQRFLDEADATELAQAEAALRRREAQQGPAALPRDGSPGSGSDGTFQRMITPDN